MKQIFQLMGSMPLVRHFFIVLSITIQLIYGILSRIKTGVLFPKARGKNCYISLSSVVKYPEKIEIGYGLRVGPQCILGGMGGISFGDNVRLSKGVVVETGGLDIYVEQPPYKHIAKSIKIESGVWIGVNSIVLGGVTIGKNAVIGAGSVVTNDVPENMVYAGNPAKVIKKRI